MDFTEGMVGDAVPALAVAVHIAPEAALQHGAVLPPSEVVRLPSLPLVQGWSFHVVRPPPVLLPRIRLLLGMMQSSPNCLILEVESLNLFIDSIKLLLRLHVSEVCSGGVAVLQSLLPGHRLVGEAGDVLKAGEGGDLPVAGAHPRP